MWTKVVVFPLQNHKIRCQKQNNIKKNLLPLAFIWLMMEDKRKPNRFFLFFYFSWPFKIQTSDREVDNSTTYLLYNCIKSFLFFRSFSRQIKPMTCTDQKKFWIFCIGLSAEITSCRPFINNTEPNMWLYVV